MRAEIKEGKGLFMICVFGEKGELLNTQTHFYDELEEKYRIYLSDMAEDSNFNIRTIEDWDDWIVDEKEVLADDLLADTKPNMGMG